ncbi:MAG: hypothetical protein CMK98_13735 [Pseudomonas sp.]|nr:hypothetical protein [Pseudomonas sp.]
MSWTDCVHCSTCRVIPNRWQVVNGAWVCLCGALMTEAAIQAARKARRLADNQGLPTVDTVIT